MCRLAESDIPHISHTAEKNQSKHDLFCRRILLRRFPARSWEELRTHNGVTWRRFIDTGYYLGLVTDPNQEAQIDLHDAVDLGRPLYEIRFLVAQMVSHGARRELLEDHFLPYLEEPGDSAKDVHRRLNRLIHRDIYPDLAAILTMRSHDVPSPRTLLKPLNTEQLSVTFQILDAVLNPSEENRLMVL